MMIPDNTFLEFLERYTKNVDAAHDISHIKRVVANAEHLCDAEHADNEIVRYAAWLHDCVIVPKSSPDRNKASGLAAKEAVSFLKSCGFDHKDKLTNIAHCIEAHSFSANIKPRTTEAKVVQDADRLDALGAIGIARCLITGSSFGATLYHPEEPEPVHRTPDEKSYIIDHFYEKLLRLPDTMQTAAGRKEALIRCSRMETWLGQLYQEIGNK